MKSKENFSFKAPVSIEGFWMIGLTISEEVYNSIFNITKENKKIELYVYPYSEKAGITYAKVRNEMEKFRILQPPIYKMKQ